MNIVLLSGGSGQRLWPLSNDIRSKQFIKIFHKEDGSLESMVQRVYRQIKTIDMDATVTIATSKSQVSAIHNQLGENVGISVEPCRRDTFPAIALAAAYLKDVQGVGEEESVVVCPVDPYVEDDYFEALKALGERAQKSDSNTERRQKVHYRADEIAFRVLLCVNGCGTISCEDGSMEFYKGDCIFVPADSEVLTISGQAQFLDVRG